RAPVRLASLRRSLDADCDAPAVVTVSRLDHHRPADGVSRPDGLDLGLCHDAFGYGDPGPSHELLGEHLVASDVHADRRRLLPHPAAPKPGMTAIAETEH